MRVPLTLIDFLDRAELFGDRTLVVDEPGGPASLGRVSAADLVRRARGMARELDRLGVDHGARVAIVSPNSARFVIALFGVSAFGRVLVPVNFRLNARDVTYITEHSGAEVLLVDPELDEALADVGAPHRIVLDGEQDAALMGGSDEPPAPWEPDEDATASINYTSGTTARPKGVQLTHRTLWLHAASIGWHLGVGLRDVYLQALPLFHCNGWGIPYGLAAMGGRQVMLRRVDGAEILRRVEDEGVTLTAGAPAVLEAALAAARPLRERGEPVPGDGRTRVHGGGRRPADLHDPPDRGGARLGVHARLRPHRGRAPAHHHARAGRVGRPRAPTSAPPCSPGRACRRWGCACAWTSTARCSPAPTTCWRPTGTTPTPAPRPSTTGGSTPATGAGWTTTSTWSSPTARRT